MSGQLTTSASKVLELGANGQIKAKVDFVCRSQPSQKQPELLDIAISTYSLYDPKGESVAANISRHFQVRLDDLPASEFDEPLLKYGATEEANTSRINFQYYYTENPNFAKLIASKLSFTETPKLSPGWNEIQRNNYAKDVEIVKNFKSTDIETLSGSLHDIFYEGVEPSIPRALASATNNFKWSYRKLLVRVTAKSALENEYTGDLVLPLDDTSIVRVADACGWSQNPSPISVQTPPTTNTPQGDTSSNVTQPNNSPPSSVPQAPNPPGQQTTGETLALPPSAPSFDCNKATSPIDKRICANPDLAKLDAEVAVAYKTKKQSGYPSDALLQQQRAWMKVRNGCGDDQCLVASYQGRLAELK